MSWPDRHLARGEVIVGRWTSRGIAFGSGLVGLYGLLAIIVFLAGEVGLGGDGATARAWLLVAALAARGRRHHRRGGCAGPAADGGRRLTGTRTNGTAASSR